MGENQKSIFEFDDYRELIKALFERNKLADKKFSYRYFAKRAGFVSHSFLQFVVDGKSDLSAESIEKFAKGFKMNREEAHFFKHLVLHNQAKTADEKQLHAREILRSRSYRRLHPLSNAQYNFYGHWYFVPIREIVNFPNFREDPEWIAKTIVPNITPEQARGALRDLLELGLLVRNGAGKLVQSNPLVSTADEVVSSAIAQWHKDMMKRAAESIDRFNRDERDISGVTIGVTKAKIGIIKERIQKFRKELVDVISGETACDAVYQLNLHFFSLADAKLGDGNEKN
jgi:uncharacterized protein (TIGR02147 family)